MLVALSFLIAWLIVWVWLFRDCARSAALHPLFGSQKRARKLWFVLFLAFNPILVGLYAFLGRTRWSGRLRPATRNAVFTAVALLGIWMQVGGSGTPRLIGDVKTNPPSTPWSLAIQANTFSNSSSLQTMTPGGRLLAPRSLRVTYSDDEFSRAAALLVARDLALEEWTEMVELWPRDERPKDGGLGPDLYVDIATSDVLALPTPFIQVFRGTLHLSVSCVPYPMGSSMGADGLPNLALPEYRGSVIFSFNRVGSALGSAVYGDVADNFSQWVRLGVIEELRTNASDGGLVGNSNAQYEPRSVELPAPLAAKELHPLGREHGRFVHERAWFRFEDDRPAYEVLVELSNALAAEGWNETWGSHQDGERSVVIADLGGIRLTVGKWPRPEWRSSVMWVNGKKVEFDPGPVSASPYVATLESRFTRSEFDAITDELARDPVDIEGLLAFSLTLKGEPLAALREAMHANPEASAKRWLQLAQLDNRAKDEESALRSVWHAHRLARMDHDRSTSAAAHRLGKELDDSFPRYPMAASCEQLVAAGFRLLTAGEKSITQTLPRGHRARFVVDNGDKGPVTLSVILSSVADPGQLEFVLWTDHMESKQIEVPGGSSTPWLNGAGFRVESEQRGKLVDLRVSHAGE